MKWMEKVGKLPDHFSERRGGHHWYDELTTMA
jgi:hypothetical protein